MTNIALSLGDGFDGSNGPIIIYFEDIETKQKYANAELIACKHKDLKICNSISKEERTAAKAERYKCRKQFAINQGYGPRTRNSNNWFKLPIKKDDVA